MCSVKRHISIFLVLICTLVIGLWQFQSGREQQETRYPKATPTSRSRGRAPRVTASKAPQWMKWRQGPPAQRKFTMLADSYTISGTGTDWDGEYPDSGSTQDGVAYFALDGSHLLFRDGAAWYLADSLGNLSGSHYIGGGALDPLSTSGSWSLGPDGTGSAPTIAESAGTPSPDIPADPTFSLITDTSLRVTFPSLPANAASMLLERSPHGAGTWTQLVSSQPAGATYNDSGLTPGAHYDYRISAVGDGGTTAGNAVEVQLLPSTPGTASFSSVASTTATITYPSLPTGATSLSLERRPHGSGSYTVIDSGRSGGATFNETGRTAGAEYDYRVIAVNGSATATGSVAVLSLLSAAPGTASFSAITQTTATITLPSLPTGATTLSLERSANGTTGWSSLVTGQAGGATYSETGRTAATTYYYRVIAVNGAGSNTGSNASMTMLPNAPSAPSAPTFTSITSTSFNVVLPSMPSGGVTMNLQASADGSTGWSNVSTGLSGGASVSQSGKANGTTYYYRAVSVNTGGTTNGTSGSVTTTMPTPGNASLRIYWPFSEGAKADLVVTGTGAVQADYTEGTAIATTIATETLVQGGSGESYTLHNAAFNGAAVDFKAAHATGYRAHLYALYATGASKSLTVTLQDSADGSTGWADIGTFATLTAVGAVSLVVAAPGAVRRYVRAIIDTGDVTGNWAFTVGFSPRA